MKTLNALDYAVLLIFFAVNLTVGWYASRRKQNADDFMRGGGRTPWWAAGISYFATSVSSISFMAIPAKTYAGDWLSFGSAPSQVLATLIVALVFVATLRRLNITTVFEYLELRFNRPVRLFGAALTLLLKVFGRMSIVMLLPSIALSTVTGLNVYWCIIALGVATMIYSIHGGFKAVVWTDILQVAVMFGGACIAFFYIFSRVPGGFAGVMDAASGAHKLHTLEWAFDFTRPSVWVFLGMAWGSIFVQLSDQPLMQRVFSTADVRSARSTVILGAVMALPTQVIFFFLGTCLFVYFKAFPGHLTTVTDDAIFPYFIANELPHGIVGLIIAALFASSMGALSGALNSAATIVVTDGYGVFRPAASEAGKLRVARLATFIVGTVAMAMAAYIASLGVKSLWDQFLKLIALIGGGLPGVFAVGLLSRRANAGGVMIGLIVSIVLTWWVQTYTAIDVFFHSFIAVTSCMIVGYLASFAFPPAAYERRAETLTIWKKAAPVPAASPALPAVPTPLTFTGKGN